MSDDFPSLAEPFNLAEGAAADARFAPLLRFLQALPKVELHCHLLGSVRRGTLEDWVCRAGQPISLQEVAGFYERRGKPVGAIRVLRALDAELIRAPDDLYRLAIEYLQDAAGHSVRYAEFFWNPTGTATLSGVPYARAADAIVRAIRDAAAQFGIESRLVPSIDREAPPQAALEMLDWMQSHPLEEVVGIGIDYREQDRPPEMFAEAFARARRLGLRTTAHAGEFGLPWHNVRTALDLLKVDRIDHGYTVVDQPALLHACVDRGIVFTVAPTNSHYLRTLAPERWALDHPIRRMLAAGLAIHPNTDDPTLHQVTPTQAWAMMAVNFGASLSDLRRLMLNGLQGAWIDEPCRASWRRDWSAAFDRLSAGLPGARPFPGARPHPPETQELSR